VAYVWRGGLDPIPTIRWPDGARLGGQGEQRFRREGRLLGRLDHPCIARLIDAGILDGRQPYLVLEHVDGWIDESQRLLDASAQVPRRRRCGLAQHHHAGA